MHTATAPDIAFRNWNDICDLSQLHYRLSLIFTSCSSFLWSVTSSLVWKHSDITNKLEGLRKENLLSNLSKGWYFFRCLKWRQDQDWISLHDNNKLPKTGLYCNLPWLILYLYHLSKMALLSFLLCCQCCRLSLMLLYIFIIFKFLIFIKYHKRTKTNMLHVYNTHNILFFFWSSDCTEHFR